MRPGSETSRALVMGTMATMATSVLLLCLGGVSIAAESVSDEPLDSRTVEEVDVNLTMLDVFVLDKRGEPVTDLTLDDFELVADGKLVPLDTMDNACATADRVASRVAAAAIDAGVDAGEARGTAGLPGLVLAFDYLHLDRIQRVDAIEQVRAMVRKETIEGYRVMLVALAGGVRIEQGFTDDRDALVAGLERMQNDPTLAVPDFYHRNSFIFVEGLTALFDVLGSETGNKAVILFSAMRDVPFDSQFEEIAAIAASSRSAIYPVDVRGLTTPTLFDEDLDDIKTAVRTRLDTSPGAARFQESDGMTSPSGSSDYG